MKSNCSSKVALVIVLSASLLATGCSAQWIGIALADLPVLLQMALNLGTVVTTLQSGKQLSPAEAAAIQSISAESGKDLNLLQALYKEYKANPNSTTMQKIQNAVADINQNLPALLQAAHISDPALAARVTVAVNLILATVNSFAALIPQTTMPTARSAGQKAAMPHAADLKKQWNQQVCAPTGKAGLDSAMGLCPLK